MIDPRTTDPYAAVLLVSLRTLRGASFWSPLPVTRLDLAVGAYDEISTACVPGLPEALLAALPGLVEHRCSIGERGGFMTRLRRGTYIPHVVEHLALELQSAVGHEVGYGRARGGDRPGEYTVVFEHRHAGVGRRAGVLALQLAQTAFAGERVDAAAAIAELEALATSPDDPELQRSVACGITGGGDRERVRRELIRRTEMTAEQVVEMPPSAILETGLAYSRSRTAVILDLEPGEVPARYRDPEYRRRLMAVVADAVPRGGVVVAPAGEPELHELILDQRRRVALFTTAERLAEHDGRIAHAVASVRGDTILVEDRGRVTEHPREAAARPHPAEVAAALAAIMLQEE